MDLAAFIRWSPSFVGAQDWRDSSERDVDVFRREISKGVLGNAINEFHVEQREARAAEEVTEVVMPHRVRRVRDR